MTHIGIDIGTFHSVAVGATSGQVAVPKRSVPSIALLARGGPIVGFDAEQQLDLGYTLIQAPKLLLDSREIERRTLGEVLRKLSLRAGEDLGLGTHHNTVATVPPGWNLEQCDLMSQALSPSFPRLTFFHEPIALLVAAWRLAPEHEDPSYYAKLSSFREVIVCDWGAGTVDLAAVSVSGTATEPVFRCVGEVTDATWGGTRIARSAVGEFRKAGRALPTDDERAVLYLQQFWSDRRPSPIPLEELTPFISKLRQNAAFSMQAEVSRLLRKFSDSANVLFVMHGGPLESDELRDQFRDALETIGIARERQMHVGSDFVNRLRPKAANLRRDALVALGAAVFAESGRTLPEYEYRLNLRDASGRMSSSVRLAVTPTTRGLQAVNPPFTGVDYSVEVQQVRDDTDTPLRKELAIFVRDEALLLYRISEAGVGFANIEAVEARNLPAPKPFADSKPASVKMPERSTRFQMNFRRS